MHSHIAKLISVGLLLASTICANAQAQKNIIQSGTVTPGHALSFVTDGVARDAGTATNGFLTAIGVMASGQAICQNSGPVTGAYQQICLGVTGTGGQITFGNFGGAPPGALTATINGNNYVFPFTPPATAVQGPNSTTVGNFATWNNTGGTLLANGTSPAGLTALNIYTPSGTGGQATSLQHRLDHMIFVKDYGAVCDFATNDTVAQQNAINEGVALGVAVRYTGTGLCVTTAPLQVNGVVDIGGTGQNGPGIFCNACGTGIKINWWLQVNIHDLGIGNVNSGNTDTGITVDCDSSCTAISSGNENSSSYFSNIIISGFLNGFHAIRGEMWMLTHSVINGTQSGGRPIWVENQFNTDHGDAEIDGTLIQGNGGPAIYQTSSGGLRVENNKILCSSCNRGYYLNLCSACFTGDLFIVGNSFEGVDASGSDDIRLVRQGATGSFGTITIVGNELSSGGGNCVTVPLDANGAWLTGLVIVGNVCATGGTTGTGFSIASTTGFVVADNVLQGNATTNFSSQINASATKCFIGPNPIIGTFSASTTAACSTLAPF
jgi:hypothetical protein